MLTARGRLALLLAAGLYILAWGFGIDEAYPVAIGLLLLVLLAAVYVRLGSGPFRVRRRTGGGEHVEGTDLPVRVEVRPERGRLPRGAVLEDALPGGGHQVVPLTRDDDALCGEYVLAGLPRGRYTLDGSRVAIEDPFGLERAASPLDGGGALLVLPRISDLEGLFTDSGSAGSDGRRQLLARTSGYDLHSVREYVQGESLRRVDWKSTAKRGGRLMVKELEDAPRDEAAVVLDAQAGLDVGAAPDSSFEMQVRAAGSLLRRLAGTNQRSALVVAGARLERRRVQSLEGDWRSALELLAAVRPDGTRPLAGVFDDERASLDAIRLYLVTSALSPRLGDRIAALSGGRLSLAVVWVDARTWGPGPVAAGAPDGVALHLQRLGVPVARVRRGDDLRAVLSAARAGASVDGLAGVGA